MSQIPQILHYIWFGKSPLPPLVETCVESWKKSNPMFTIKRWDESNFDIEKYPFASRMYKEKKWAFVADYARLIILKEEGGVYLDTDMMLHKDLSPLLKQNTLVLGEEAPHIISAGMIACTPHHQFILDCQSAYDSLPPSSVPPTIPSMLTKVFSLSAYNNVQICQPEYFYPFSIETIRHYDKNNPPASAYGVHLWNFSWGTWYQRLLHKNWLYKRCVVLLELLGIKTFLKNLLKLS